MPVIKIFHFLKGYVIIFVEGLFVERFINICIKRGVYLWDLKKLSKTTMRCKVSISGFKSLRGIAAKSGVKVHISARRGLPFKLAGYKKRYALVFGAVLCAALFWALTSFLWIVDINGNESITKAEVLDALGEAGIKKGVYMKNINTDKAVNSLRIKLDRLAWVGIEKSGSKLIVSVKERTLGPPVVDKDTPVNLVATKDGIIRKLIVASGNTVVKLGDTVSKGDLLVSGLFSTETGESRYVHSKGRVFARTFYEKRENLSLFKEEKTYTGNEISKKSIKIWNFPINLYFSSSISYDKCDKIEKKHNLKIAGFEIPVVYVNDIYKEYTVSKAKLDKQSAVNNFAKKFEEGIKSTFGPEDYIVEIRSEILSENNKTVGVRMYAECNENIACEEEFAVEGAKD